MADALDYVHALGIVHRDIKPQNIMLDGPGRRLVLMGFSAVIGIAPLSLP